MLVVACCFTGEVPLDVYVSVRYIEVTETDELKVSRDTQTVSCHPDVTVVPPEVLTTNGFVLLQVCS